MLTLDDRLAEGFTGGPRYATSIIPLSGGKERRNATWPLPRRAYEFSYNNRLIEDCWALEDFFHDVDGMAQTWLMPDFSLPLGRFHIIGTGDGADTTFQARIGYGNTSLRYINATNLVAGSWTVRVNGVTVSVSSEASGLFTLAAPPANTAVVTASFVPLITVRFEQDDLQIKVTGPGGKYGAGTPLSAVEVR